MMVIMKSNKWLGKQDVFVKQVCPETAIFGEM